MLAREKSSRYLGEIVEDPGNTIDGSLVALYICATIRVPSRYLFVLTWLVRYDRHPGMYMLWYLRVRHTRHEHLLFNAKRAEHGNHDTSSGSRRLSRRIEHRHTKTGVQILYRGSQYFMSSTQCLLWPSYLTYKQIHRDTAVRVPLSISFASAATSLLDVTVSQVKLLSTRTKGIH